MRRDVGTKGQDRSIVLGKLIHALSVPETCTPDVLNATLGFLGSSRNSKRCTSKTASKTVKAASNGPRGNVIAAPPVVSCSSREAQRLVKVSLATLKSLVQAKTTKDKFESKDKSKKLVGSRQGTACHATYAEGVLASICAHALTIWATEVGQTDKEFLLLVKVAYNLTSLLLELGDLDRSLRNLVMLRCMLMKNDDNACFDETVTSSVQESALLSWTHGDLVINDLEFVINSQILVLRYAQLAAWELSDGDLFCLSPNGAVFEWCLALALKDKKQANKFLVVVNRHLLKIASKAAKHVRLKAHILVFESMLREEYPELRFILSSFCHVLDEHPESSAFADAKALATKIIDLRSKSSEKDEQRLYLLLTDRMTRYAQILALDSQADKWAQQSLDIAASSNIKVALVLDKCALSLSSAENTLTCSQAMSSAAQAISSIIITSSMVEEDWRVIAKSTATSKQSILRCLKSHSTTESAARRLFSILADTISRMLDSSRTIDRQLCAPIMQLIIQGWLVAFSTKHRSAQSLELDEEEVQNIVRSTRQFGLETEFHALTVALFNKAGILYSSGSYAIAATLLETYFDLCPLEHASVKRVEYLWSAYLQCQQWDKALHWLMRAIAAESEVVHGHKITIIESTMEEFAELSRLLAKFVAQSKKSEIVVSRFLPTSRDRVILLEMLLRAISLSGLPSSDNAEFMQCFQELMRQEDSSQYDDVDRLRVVGFAASYLRRNNDLHNLRIVLAAEKLNRAMGTTSSDNTTVKLYNSRLLFHRLILIREDVHQAESAVRDLSAVSESEEISKNSSATGLYFQVLNEAAEILRVLRMPASSLHILQILLSLNLTYQILSSEQLMEMHTLAAEQALACGIDAQVKAHLAQAERFISAASTSAEQNLKFESLSIMYCLSLNAKDILNHLAKLLSYLQLIPINKRPEVHAEAFLLMAEVAERLGMNGCAIHRGLEALSLSRQCLSRSEKRHAKFFETAFVEGMASLTLGHAFTKSASTIAAGLIVLSASLYLARTHEKCGMIKDALYYAEEAVTTASTLQQADLMQQTLLFKLLLQSKLGQLSCTKEHEIVPTCHNLYLRSQQYEILASLWAQQSPQKAAQWYLAGREGLNQARQLFSSFDKSRPVSKSRKDDSKRPISARKIEAAKLPQVAKLFDRLDQKILCELINMYERTGNTEQAERHRASLIVKEGEDQFLPCILEATGKLRNIHAMLAKDPVYGTIRDSALSLPNTTLAAAEPSKLKRKTAKSLMTSGISPDKIAQILAEAKNTISDHFEPWLSTGDSRAAYVAGNLYSTMNVMQSSILASDKDAHITSASSNYFLEMSRATNIERDIERRLFETSAESDLEWSERISLMERQLAEKPDVPTKSTFQSQYHDVLPASWAVISIGLSPSKKELVITRMQAQKSPFLLNLPLSRHASRDVDEETFEFIDANHELLDIICKSNDSAQEAKHIRDKKGKAQWWTLRQELDTRMKTLLQNIEHCWLGGFKGILGRPRSDLESLENFRSAFARILSKHVPLSKDRCFDLDARILDLFVDLGPIAAEDSLELLEDLLYFVLDIYQFHGESIAYDEIEIDEMVVDVQTALNKYHDSSAQGLQEDHTILIFDKDLHIFPWESIPFLRGRSISRVPSLRVLTRLLDARAGHDMTIPRLTGSFILNPAGDLKTTEKTFKTIFEELPNWHGIVARKPEEKDFLQFLETSNVFMYFGHGGGEQYVRASKIKRLESCGAVILMGCSSGALKNQGEFDPWGTPYNYLVAGCPCLVANLWDVTDKDIDRFSLEMLSRWSLIDGPHEAVSICAAVAQSRDECNLQYLNGAAPVVYGLPLKLSSKGQL